MKKLLLALVIVLFSMSAFTQTRLYVNPAFSQKTKNHKEIAVLPFQVTLKLRPRQLRDITPQQLKDMEFAQGKGIQSAMFSWFLARGKKGQLKIRIQNPMTTNAMLKKKGISIKNITDYTPKELANFLGVDAVIMGTLETNKPISTGASIALGVITGFYGVTNKATMNLFIYNGKDGDVLVNYHKAVAGSLGSTIESMVNILMRKASRRIPYFKR
ncbi:hypothetical protein MNBD_BACTEROID07-724 [hydrothermal vent metagenome]|uniref:Secreted protein n=1 Tax=hydrothermal vent metagenome TaxID=652676 RepID=A0A3B0UHX4_9ZZZZ